MRFISQRWIFGALIALGIVWGTSALLLNSIAPLVYDDVVQRYVKAPGTHYNHRSEGWATSIVGKHGIIGIPDITQVKDPKIAIWGDSFVEALQVNDETKTAQVLTRLMGQAQMGITAFSIGNGGLSLADYYFSIPKYERAIPGIVAHVVVIGSIMDVLPDFDTLCHSRFLSSPPRLEEADCIPSHYALQYTPWLNRLALPFVYELYQKVTSSPLRIVPGTASRGTAKPQKHPVFIANENTLKAWDYLLRKYTQLTSIPIVFLYNPELPLLTDNGLSFNDPNQKVVDQFATKCAEHGLQFINTGSMLIDHFETTKTLSRGFFNMPPGQGHFNKDGHRIAARALFNHFKEQDNAFQ